MKKKLVLMITGVMAAQLLSGCALQLPHKEAEPTEVKIGIITGADDENHLQQVIAFAEGQQTAAAGRGGTYTFSAEYADAGSTEQSAAQAAQQLREAGVSAVISLCDDALTAAAAEAVQDAHLSVIAPNGGDFEDLTNVFSLNGSEVLEAAAAAHYAYYDLGLTSAAVITDASETGSAEYASLFANVYSAYGGRLVVHATVEGDLTEVQTELAEQAPDLLYASVSAETMLSLMQSNDGDTVYMSSNMLDSQHTLTTLGTLSEGLVVTSFVDAENTETAETRELFAEWLGEDAARTAEHENGTYMGTEELLTSDAWSIIIQATADADSADADQVYAKLVGMSMNGASGQLSFGGNLEAERESVYLTTVSGGTFTKTAEVTASDTVM